MHMMTRNIYEPALHVAILSLAFVGFAARPGKAQAGAAITPQAQQVITFMRERKLAFERGDASAWGRHVAERCLLIEAGGRTLGKAQRMAEMGPFVGYTFSAVVNDVRAPSSETPSS
jgi:hypothetical protein